MKKFLISLLSFGVLSCTLFAGEIKINADSQDVASYNARIAEIGTPTTYKACKNLAMVKTYLALVGKDTQNMTFAEFKSTIDAVVFDVFKNRFDGGKLYRIEVLPRVVRWAKRFRGFTKNVLADSEYANSVFVLEYFVASPWGGVNAAEFRTILFENKQIITLRSSVRRINKCY